jgi:signal transduction histidine kinase
MRLRVILLVLAVGSLMLVSFMVPLALLLRAFAADNAITSATNRAQDMAPLAATASVTSLEAAVDLVNQQNPNEPMTVYLPGAVRLGAAEPWSSTGVQLAEQGQSFPEHTQGGVTVFVSVQGLAHGNGTAGTAVIRVFVPNAQLRSGVAKSWLVLGLVAVGLLAMAVIVAAQLTRSLVKPLRNVALAAEQLTAGDLDARAPVDAHDPPEIRQVSAGLNRLAERITQLLTHERETLADLSHRLRTPLTALRIDAELLTGDEEIMTRVIGDVDTLTRTVNEIIDEARRPSAGNGAATCDATMIVRARAAYWHPLAEDQERWMTVEIPPHSLPVLVSGHDLAACVDILLENVFAHTPEGTSFAVRVSHRAGGGAWLVVSDNGPGFSHPDLARRGESSAGSTGLGLDIARRIAERSGGSLTLGRSPHGGGAVTIGLGPAIPQVRRSRRHIRTKRQPSLS